MALMCLSTVDGCSLGVMPDNALYQFFFWIKLPLCIPLLFESSYHCLVLTTVFSVILLHKMGCITFSCTKKLYQELPTTIVSQSC